VTRAGARSADAAFWRGRRVLLTGHTGFKGSWLALRLAALGAAVTGLSLDPPTDPSLFALAGVGGALDDRRGDVRDNKAIAAAVAAARPDVVFHLAAQALVKVGLEQPIETLEVNVMGVARLLEALKGAQARAIVVVTSDKVYRNDGAGRPFAEAAALGGGDPYSGSKSAAEMVARLYRESFGLPVVTARAGNVVGGGDFALDRLLPDAWRAHLAAEPLVLRQHASTRPWSHALDIAEGYLLYAEAVAEERAGLPAALNFGPAPDAPVLTALETAGIFASALGRELSWRPHPAPFPERPALALASSAARRVLGWGERHPGAEGVRAAAQWYAALAAGEDVAGLSRAEARHELEPAAARS
jgi:CDP-glucose 4,6-dehydratase